MNLKTIIKSYQSDYNENSTHYILKCPECNREKLYVDKKEKLFICFRCGIKGGFVGLVRYLKNVSCEEAYRIINNNRRVDSKLEQETLHSLTHFWEKVEKRQKSKLVFLPDDCRPLSFYDNDGLLILNDYLEERELTKLHSYIFDLGYSQKMQRLIFPIYSGYELVGWQGRTIFPNVKPKMLNNLGLNKSDYLYNYDTVFDNGVKSLILSEGPIDCIKANGVMPAVALFGKTMSRKQFNDIITLSPDKLYIGLDFDAEKQAFEIARKFFCFIPEVYVLNIPEGRDLGDSSIEEIEGYIRCASVASVTQNLNLCLEGFLNAG